MSVTYFSREKPHKGGFIGFRVAVMVNRKHHQRYFSTKHNADYNSQFLLAHKLNSRWLAEQEKAISGRNNRADPTSRAVNGTGVRGIQIRFFPSTASKRFVVHGAQDGKRFYKSFDFTEKCWIEAVTFLAKKKKLTRWRHLLNRYIFWEE